MLEDDYRQRYRRLLNELVCRVQIPEEWSSSYFSENGVLPTAWNERRRFVRHCYRAKCVLELQSTLPAIDRRPGFFAVYSRDISRNGISFLHVAELFPDERCRLWLPTQQVALRVARCRRYNSQCFLIGARTIQERDADAANESGRERLLPAEDVHASF